MIGIVLVTHGRLAVEFRPALEHVVGPQAQIETVTIGPDDDVEQRRKDIIEAVKRVDTGDGVVDPHRHVRRHAVQPRDLGDEPAEGRGARRHQPADADQAREGPRRHRRLPEAVAAAQEAGRKYITIASRVLAGK